MNGIQTGDLTIALSKGKLLKPALDLFARVGLITKKISPGSRRLIFEQPASRMTIMIIRPSDVPTYVEYGAVDVGIVGADMLMEQATDVYEPLDLGFGACRLAVAGPPSAPRAYGMAPLPWQRLTANLRGTGKLRVATKYPNLTERHFSRKGIPIEIIKLYGSIELAPLVGLADCIVDLVSSGKTLRAHNLVVQEVIAESQARLIVNRASLKLKYQRMNDLIETLRKGLHGGRREGARFVAPGVGRVTPEGARPTGKEAVAAASGRAGAKTPGPRDKDPSWPGTHPMGAWGREGEIVG
jgi:ATP phosphoribosyltransferase